MSNVLQTAVFGGGCFWCTEAIFQNLRGVVSVMPGYAGGEKADPSYDQVSSGNTGHAEVVKIEFNPMDISYQELLEVFFATHDPTTPNQQGADIGIQYRSVILYTTNEQRDTARKYIKDHENEFAAEIVTEIKPLEKFFEAEKYHKNYYTSNPDKPYCQLVINPKLAKLRQKFAKFIKN